MIKIYFEDDNIEDFEEDETHVIYGNCPFCDNPMKIQISFGYEEDIELDSLETQREKDR